jgi:hypothetical protein
VSYGAFGPPPLADGLGEAVGRSARFSRAGFFFDLEVAVAAPLAFDESSTLDCPGARAVAAPLLPLTLARSRALSAFAADDADSLPGERAVPRAASDFPA